MTEKNTGELQGELKKAKDVTAFLQENKDELQVKTLPEYLAALLEKKGMTKKEAVHASRVCHKNTQIDFLESKENQLFLCFFCADMI